MRQHRRLAIMFVATVGTAALGLAAAQETASLEILMGEFFFQVEGQEPNAPIVLQAGTTYELEFENVGDVLHEVLVGRGLVTGADGPDGYETDLFEGLEMDLEGEGWEAEVTGLVEFELEPGAELEIVVTLPEDRVGEWEIACFVPGHYEAGMRADVIIE